MLDSVGQYITANILILLILAGLYLAFQSLDLVIRRTPVFYTMVIGLILVVQPALAPSTWMLDTSNNPTNFNKLITSIGRIGYMLLMVGILALLVRWVKNFYKQLRRNM